MAAVQLSEPPDGGALFGSALATIERVIGFVSARHHLMAAEAEDFASHAKLKLIEDDCAILRKFAGRCTLRTFLTTVVNNLFLDYRNNTWGKWRPSAEAKRGGPVAVLIEQLTTRDGHTFEEACELLAAKYGVTLSRAELEGIAARLPIRHRRRFESDEALVGVPSDEPGPDEIAMKREQRLAAARVSAALAKALATLDADDRLILRLQCQDGLTVAEIARRLMLDQHALYRRFDRLLKRLREMLQSGGINSPW
jgi:RNA polymerase sigma factor (sigma-70 family)